MAERYTPTPERLDDATRRVLEETAVWNAVAQMLLNHIAWLETESRAAYVAQQEAARNTAYRAGDRRHGP